MTADPDALASMKIRTLGDGLQVSALGLGCMPMVGTGAVHYEAASEAESMATIHRAIDLGVNFFEGDYRRHDPRYPEANFARNLSLVEVLKTVGAEHGASAAQVALAWLRTRPVPVIPILGARRLQQLEDNLASLTLTLSPGQVARLDEASAIELGFPYHLYSRELVRQLVHAGMRERIIT